MVWVNSSRVICGPSDGSRTVVLAVRMQSIETLAVLAVPEENSC